MGEVVNLSDRRRPVCYSLHISHEWDGFVSFVCSEVDLSDARVRKSVATTLLDIAARLETATDEEATEVAGY